MTAGFALVATGQPAPPTLTIVFTRTDPLINGTAGPQAPYSVPPFPMLMAASVAQRADEQPC